jgi:hypothetical protein
MARYEIVTVGGVNHVKYVMYKGHRYRLAFLGIHKECEDGTHWNEKTRRCQKVSEGLQAKMDAAHRATHLQKDEAERRYVGHEKRVKDHYNARDRHQEAASAAKEEGFNKLSKEHSKQAKRHNDAVDALHAGSGQ